MNNFIDLNEIRNTEILEKISHKKLNVSIGSKVKRKNV